MESLIEELKLKIIKALNLEEVKPADIKADAPLFATGLGLDSIDALELVVMLEKDYGIVIENTTVAQKAFGSVQALAQFVSDNRPSCKTQTPS